MKSLRVILLFLCVLMLSCNKIENIRHLKLKEKKSLKIAMIDFFSSDSLKIFINDFAKKNRIRIEFYDYSSSSEFYKAYRKTPKQIDVVVGLKSTDLLLGNTKFVPVNIKAQENKYKRWNYYVFAHNYLTILYNKSMLKDVPQTYAQLTDDGYGKSFILFDPGKSDIGRDFIVQTASAFGNDAMRYFWDGFKINVLRLEDTWKNGNLRFLAEEVPFISGYISEAAYHNSIENDQRFSAIYFQEGVLKVDFGCAKLHDSKSDPQADKLIKELLSEDFQKKIPFLIWMYPETTNYRTPDEMAPFPKPVKIIEPKLAEVNNHNIKTLIQQWYKYMDIVVGENDEQ